MTEPSWLSEYTEGALRGGLAAAGTGLEDLPLELTGAGDPDQPTWATGHARIDGRFLAKFALSEPTAVRIWHEARVLELFSEHASLDVPELVAASRQPACFATRIVDGGVPLSYELVCASLPQGLDAIGAELADFLAKLHAPEVLGLASAHLDAPLRVPSPGLQASTDELRERFAPMLDRSRRALVLDWCEWVDEQLAVPCEVVFVHGDFHAYNQLWDPERLRLLLVADFETSGVAAPEYDFRMIPSFGPGVDVLRATIDRYVALTGRRISVERIMALHVCTTLGDALWRSEAGLPLLLARPGGGTPSDYVDELVCRFALLGLGR